MVSPVLSASDDDDDGDEKKDNEKVYSPRCFHSWKNAAVLALSEFSLTGNFFHISPTNSSSSSSSSSTLGQLFPSATRELMRYIKLCSLVTWHFLPLSLSDFLSVSVSKSVFLFLCCCCVTLHHHHYNCCWCCWPISRPTSSTSSSSLSWTLSNLSWVCDTLARK